MGYKVKALKNRIWLFFVRERSLRFSMVSFLVVLFWGVGLTVFVTWNHDILLIASVLCFLPVCCAVAEIVQSVYLPSVYLVRGSSFLMVVIFIIATVIYSIVVQTVLSDCIILLFLIDVLIIATNCVRPSLQSDVDFIKKSDKATCLLYLICAERVMVWPITCTVLVLADIALGIGGELLWIITVMVILFSVALYMQVVKTLTMLRT